MPRLILLTSHPELHTPRRIRDELRARDVDCEFFRPGDCPGKLGLVRGDTLLLTRAGPFNLVRVLRVQRQLESLGSTALASRHAFLDAADQWRTLRRLAGAGVPVPRSTLCRSPRVDPEAVPGPSWFVKGRLGSRGSHVLLAATPEQLKGHVRFLWGQGGSAVVQQDLRGSGDVRRVLVLGDDAVACVRSRQAAREHRSNWHRGGELFPETLTQAIAEIAIRATRALALPCAGVDLIGDRDPVVLEVNASPGLEGLEAATGGNQAGEFARFLRRRLDEAMQSCRRPCAPSRQEETSCPTRSPP